MKKTIDQMYNVLNKNRYNTKITTHSKAIVEIFIS